MERGEEEDRGKPKLEEEEGKDKEGRGELIKFDKSNRRTSPNLRKKWKESELSI